MLNHWKALTATALVMSTAFLTDARGRATGTQTAPAAQRPVGGRPADLVLRNGKVVTLDETRPVVEAVAVSGDTIVAIGPNQEMQAYIGPATQVIDLKGALATPG